jgi:ribonucleoside-diphosphate reductase alpha chain
MAGLMQRVASTGFVRNKLTVLQGGVGIGTVSQASVSGGTTASASATAAAIEMTQGLAVAALPQEQPVGAMDSRREQIRAAKLKGYEGDSCGECGNFTLVRNGTCLKCDTCGGTSGCS